MKHRDKVIVIGNGAVGSSYCFALVTQNIAQEIGIIDINIERADGDSKDLSDALSFNSPKNIYAASYADCKDADLVVITAGMPQKSGETRLDLVEKNLKIFKTIIDNLMASGFNGCILVASNPVDILTHAAKEFSGLDHSRVFGSGTSLDSARFKKEIASLLKVDARNVHGYILGEHGDSEFPAWSHTSVGGLNIFEWLEKHRDVDQEALVNIFFKVKNAAYEIIEKKGATYYGIAAALARITKAFFDDENSIFPLSVYCDKEYDLNGLYIGTPAIINRQGIRDIIEIPLNESEKNKMQLSAKTLRDIRDDAFKKIKEDDAR